MINQKIYVAGRRGIVGSAIIVRHLLAQGVAENHIITRTRDELELTNQAAVNAFFLQKMPAQVYMSPSRWAMQAKLNSTHSNLMAPHAS